jgi:FkbM family methyltransferase
MFDLLMHAAPSAWRRAREPLVRALLARRGAARTVNGIPLRVDPVGRHVFTPIYDEGAAACLRTHLREGMEAWNVGANVGVYALQLAHLVGAAGRVVAFEPNPAAREVLERNIARNSLQSRVEVVPSAVGSAPGTVDFYTAGADGMGRAGRPNPRLSATDRMEVPVTTLDAFASARGRLPDLVVWTSRAGRLPRSTARARISAARASSSSCIPMRGNGRDTRAAISKGSSIPVGWRRARSAASATRLESTGRSSSRGEDIWATAACLKRQQEKG